MSKNNHFKSVLTNRKARCTNCKKRVDAATGTETLMPKKDDISICVYCGHLMKYTADLQLEDIPKTEMEEIKSYFKSEKPHFWMKIERVVASIKARHSRINN